MSIMEFESGKTTEQLSGVTDAQRLEASTRQRTLEPVHQDLAPDDLPDEVIATQHLVQPAIGNIPIDSELTSSFGTQQRIDKKNHRFALAISLVAVGAVAGVSLLAFLAIASHS